MPIHMLKSHSHALRLNPSLTSNHTPKPTTYLSFLLEPNLTLNPFILGCHNLLKTPPKENSRNKVIKIPLLCLHPKENY